MRSANGSDWKKAGNVNAAGESVITQSYSFIDKTPLGGINYYRLKMNDKDGKYEYSQVKTLSFGSNNSNVIKWAPNPSKGAINVKTDGSIIDAVIITDMNGKEVYKQNNVSSGTQLILPYSLTSGIYIITFKTKDNLQTDKLLLNL